jgi:uncharacterized Zn finger protein
MRLTISCHKCKADQPDLRPRSQVVECWKCGALARLRVERTRDDWKVTIIKVDPSDAQSARFEMLGAGAAARPVKP